MVDGIRDDGGPRPAEQALLGSAAEHVTSQVPTMTRDVSVGSIRASLMNRHFESLSPTTSPGHGAGWPLPAAGL